MTSLLKWPAACVALSVLAISQAMAQTSEPSYTFTANTAAGSMTVNTALYGGDPSAPVGKARITWTSDSFGPTGGMTSYFMHASQADGGLSLTFSNSEIATEFPTNFSARFKYAPYYGAHTYPSYRVQSSHADATIPILTNLTQPSETGFNVIIAGTLNESFGSTETPFPLIWAIKIQAADAAGNVITVLDNAQALTGALQNQPFSLTAQIPVGFNLNSLNLSTSMRPDASVTNEIMSVSRPQFFADATISSIQITPFVTSVPENQTVLLMGLGLCGLGLLRRSSNRDA